MKSTITIAVLSGVLLSAGITSTVLAACDADAQACQDDVRTNMSCSTMSLNPKWFTGLKVSIKKARRRMQSSI